MIMAIRSLLSGDIVCSVPSVPLVDCNKVVADPLDLDTPVGFCADAIAKIDCLPPMSGSNLTYKDSLQKSIRSWYKVIEKFTGTVVNVLSTVKMSKLQVTPQVNE